MKISLETNRRIHSLLNQTGEMAWKQEWVGECTNHRAYSLKEVTPEEASAMISALEGVLKGLRAGYNPQSKIAPIMETPGEKIQKLRRKVLYYCHQMQWYRRDEPTGTITVINGKPQLDFDRINNYCLKYSSAHKTLNDHTIEELEGKGGLVFQFYRMSKNSSKK